MKKNYIIPVTETIAPNTTEVMVPNQMSDPSVGVNSYAFEEEDEDLEDNDPKKSRSKLWN